MDDSQGARTMEWEELEACAVSIKELSAFRKFVLPV